MHNNGGCAITDAFKNLVLPKKGEGTETYKGSTTEKLQLSQWCFPKKICEFNQSYNFPYKSGFFS